ncbi:hypothetical protein [Alkalicoccobacillus gibsonii]|uniref:hypothetical protein n=1 Tax=Alkalicoccobacillus gibsonii TaxID=79881 RepID=UPI003519CC65
MFSCNSTDPNSEQSEETNQSETIDSTSDDNSTEEVSSEETDIDQLDLGVGDTGEVHSTIGGYSITVNEVKILDEVEGEMSELDYFIRVNYTIGNIGDDEIDAREAIDTMESGHDLERSGFRDRSPYIDEIDGIDGSLSPDESITGDTVYDAYESEENYLRITEGLVGSGAVENQLRFTFQKSEAE